MWTRCSVASTNWANARATDSAAWACTEPSRGTKTAGYCWGGGEGAGWLPATGSTVDLSHIDISFLIPREGPLAGLLDLLPGTPAAVLPAHSVVMARHGSRLRSSRYGHGHGLWSAAFHGEERGSRPRVTRPDPSASARENSGATALGRRGAKARPSAYRHPAKPSTAARRALPEPRYGRHQRHVGVIREVDRRTLTEIPLCQGDIAETGGHQRVDGGAQRTAVPRAGPVGGSWLPAPQAGSVPRAGPGAGPRRPA